MPNMRQLLEFLDFLYFEVKFGTPVTLVLETLTTDQFRFSTACYAAVVINRITGLARLSVRPSVRVANLKKA